MHRSRLKNLPPRFTKTPLAAALILLSPGLAVAEGDGQRAIEEVVVTAQKRSENMQDVPISIVSLGTEALRERGIQNFVDYTQALPSVAIQRSLGAGSGYNRVYMRGIATAGDGQATTSQPSVGMYLDEMPITTIQGNLDIHMYDVARVESLSGPQGTLYGASSQAGTIRVITNKPEMSEFSASYSVEGNMVDGDDTGFAAEGFVNIPLTDNMAIRLVGWSRSDAGYVDNVRGTRTFAGRTSTTLDDITLDNANIAKDNYNTQDVIGGRAALKIDLNEDWTVTGTAIAQQSDSEGSWGEDRSAFVSGENEVTHFQEEFTDDEWYQLGLTIEGQVGSFDVSFTTSYMDREFDGSFDYSDYSYWYDTLYTTGYYADLRFDNTGARVEPNAFFASAGTRNMPGDYSTSDDGYTKTSTELRISTASDKRLRGMMGFYTNKQKHDFKQHFKSDGLPDVLLMNANEPGAQQFPDTIYLNSFDRIDTDEAIFGNISYDITDALELTVGLRFFRPEVTVKGFFGFGLGFTPIWSSNGENKCASQVDYKDAPCLNVDKGISESEHIGRVNLTWSVSEDHMVYATWSEGYRPGGINRNPAADDYVSDFLTNYEFGWKTQWADSTFQFNGAVFIEEWEDFQISFTGANAITQVANGPSADVTGIESQFLWVPTNNLEISASFAYINSELDGDYGPGGNSDGSPLAPSGTQLPVTAKFKGNVLARYGFELGGFDAYLQGTMSYEGSRASSLNVRDNAIRGDVPSSSLVDLSAGIRNENYAIDLFIKNATDEDAAQFLTSQCATGTCGTQNYGVRHRPRTIGLRFSQDF
ncbi:MAG: iron complex outermembrane receptor protein [Flavobacterium sp.]|jgi:iron complex outermembrane receptor protein